MHPVEMRSPQQHLSSYCFVVKDLKYRDLRQVSGKRQPAPVRSAVFVKTGSGLRDETEKFT